MQQILLVTFVDWAKLIFCDGHRTNGQTKVCMDGQTDMIVEIFITFLTSMSVCHKKLTSPNQQMLLINVVTYASVMKKITLGSPPTPDSRG